MTEAPEQEHGYNSPTTPHILLEVRSRDLSLINSVNTSNTNTINSVQGSSTSQNFVSTIPAVNTMAGADIKLPIFNGNGLEDREIHWFLSEAVGTMRQI